MSLRPIIIKLTPAEMLIGEHVGRMRQAIARSRNWQTLNGGPNDFQAEENHILGAQGEMATASHFNLFWNIQVGQLGGVDVGGMIEVRARRHAHGLKITNGDNDRLPFVDVYADPPSFKLNGWCIARDGKRPALLSDLGNGRAPAFWVPENILRPMLELAEWVERWRAERLSV